MHQFAVEQRGPAVKNVSGGVAIGGSCSCCVSGVAGSSRYTSSSSGEWQSLHFRTWSLWWWTTRLSERETVYDRCPLTAVMLPGSHFELLAKFVTCTVLLRSNCLLHECWSWFIFWKVWPSLMWVMISAPPSSSVVPIDVQWNNVPPFLRWPSFNYRMGTNFQGWLNFAIFKGTSQPAKNNPSENFCEATPTQEHVPSLGKTCSRMALLRYFCPTMHWPLERSSMCCFLSPSLVHWSTRTIARLVQKRALQLHP